VSIICYWPILLIQQYFCLSVGCFNYCFIIFAKFINYFIIILRFNLYTFHISDLSKLRSQQTSISLTISIATFTLLIFIFKGYLNNMRYLKIICKTVKFTSVTYFSTLPTQISVQKSYCILDDDMTIII